MLEAVMARLDSEAMPPLRQVAGAASFAELRTAPPKHLQPTAYVIPVSDRGEPNALVNATSQRVTERIGVVLAIGNFSDRRGEAAALTVESLRGDVRAALVGWQPDESHGPMEFAMGRMVAVRDGVLWWQEEFQAQSWLRRT